MPATFWERDAAYRKRIGLIVPVVLAGYAVLFLTTGRFRYEDIPRFIGWRGEIEILPEITVVPEIESIEAEPVAHEEVVRETVAFDLTPKGDVPDTPAEEVQPETQPRVVEPFEGKAQIRSMERPGARESSYTENFVLIKGAQPVYPPYEQAQGIEGMVTVEMLVDETGLVKEANVLSVMGPDSFAESALNAVRQFIFEPPIENGRPTTIWVRLRIRYRISG